MGQKVYTFCFNFLPRGVHLLPHKFITYHVEGKASGVDIFHVFRNRDLHRTNGLASPGSRYENRGEILGCGYSEGLQVIAESSAVLSNDSNGQLFL